MQNKDPEYTPIAKDVGKGEDLDAPGSSKRVHEDLDAVPSPAMMEEEETKVIVPAVEPKGITYPYKIYEGPFGRPFKLLKYVRG